MEEPAHITPTFPRGIKDSDLQNADRGVQRETALWWFVLNLEPYDLSKGGPYFGFSGAIGGAPLGTHPIGGGPNIAGFGQGTFAPSPLASLVILREEFAGVLPHDVIEEVGRILAGDWMWKSPVVQPPARPPMTASEALVALVPILDALAVELKGVEIPEVHGGIGHNRPPNESPLTEEDRKEILAKIEEAKNAAHSTKTQAASEVVSLWGEIKQGLSGFEKWSLDRINEFATEAMKEAGKETGKWLPRYVLAHLTLYSLCQAAELIVRVLHQH
jgi:hypothetical protein